MNVRVRILFKSPGKNELSSMQSLARNLTNQPASVRVSADEEPGWLIAELTMPTEPQYAALPKIECAIRLSVWDRLDVRIGFPMSEAERARADRKAEKRRLWRRRAT
jgi:hypothetical protein